MNHAPALLSLPNGSPLRLNVSTKVVLSRAIVDSQSLSLGLMRALQAADEDGELSGHDLSVLTNLARQNYEALNFLRAAIEQSATIEA